MSVLAYSYDADNHCPNCARERFGSDEHGYVPEEARDSEGNPVHAIFTTDEWYEYTGPEQTLNCGTCSQEIARYEGHPDAANDDGEDDEHEPEAAPAPGTHYIHGRLSSRRSAETGHTYVTFPCPFPSYDTALTAWARLDRAQAEGELPELDYVCVRSAMDPDSRWAEARQLWYAQPFIRTGQHGYFTGGACLVHLLANDPQLTADESGVRRQRHLYARTTAEATQRLNRSGLIFTDNAGRWYVTGSLGREA